jgi:hypothetical protein
VPLRRISSSTLMLAGPVVLTLAGLLQVTRCSWVTTSSPSSQSIRTSSLARALRRSTTSWPTAWQRHDGFVRCLWSCIAPCRGVYCDNISAVYLSTNPIQHQRTKHIEIDLHFVRERVAVGDVRVLHVPTTSQFTDFFSKGLPSSVFSEFWSNLNICGS